MSSNQNLLQALDNLDKNLFFEEVEILINNNPHKDIVNSYFNPGLQHIKERYEQNYIGLPEFLLSVQWLQNLLNELDLKNLTQNYKHIKIILGVIEGDPHDMGKNIVKRLYECYGFQVIDLGKEVSQEKFVQSTLEYEADIVGISTMMSTTMKVLEKTIQEIKKSRPECRIVTGGAFINSAIAGNIGADKHIENAINLIPETEELLTN